ncbi:unnamed protein product [Brassica oleracea]
MNPSHSKANLFQKKNIEKYLDCKLLWILPQNSYSNSDAHLSKSLNTIPTNSCTQFYSTCAVKFGYTLSVAGALEEGKLIIQKWRFGSWPDGLDSMVRITFEEPEPRVTVVNLTHIDVPEEDIRECDCGGNTERE